MRLSKRTVEAVPTQPDRDVYLWDDHLKGFGARIKPSGRRTYIIQYRNSGGTSRRMTLGRHGTLTADQARDLAKLRLAEVSQGADPAGKRAKLRRAPTVAQLLERYWTEHAEVQIKMSTQRRFRNVIRRHILPLIGERRIHEITRQEILVLQRDIGSKTRGTANLAVTILRKAFDLAVDWGWCEERSNPCHRIRPFKIRKVDRYLSSEELARLGKALDAFEDRYGPSVLAIRLLLLTGCRRAEILTLQWKWVDFERGLLLLPDSKTGSKTVVLSQIVLDLLRTVDRVEGNPYVVVGNKPGRHLVRPEWAWDKIRLETGLEDVRLHDLRHTFASYGVAANYSLLIVGKSLGHQRAETTERYAHLAVEPVRAMVEEVGAVVAQAAGMQGPTMGAGRLRLELEKPLADFDAKEREVLWGRLCELQGGWDVGALELIRA